MQPLKPLFFIACVRHSKLLIMKKNIFFGITQGLMWSFFNSSIGYKVTDWQWWAILVTGAIVFAIIYHKCKD